MDIFQLPIFCNNLVCDHCGTRPALGTYSTSERRCLDHLDFEGIEGTHFCRLCETHGFGKFIDADCYCCYACYKFDRRPNDVDFVNWRIYWLHKKCFLEAVESQKDVIQVTIALEDQRKIFS